ncbi:MAG: 6-phosphofructokinase [Fibrobacter sp.]|jgi:6-phosphofructokinase 1|nr:6-phosphofructokinase [Fibrobacter sp.]
MKIAVLTSGGDAPGMNAAIRSVVRTARARDWGVFGVQRGYEGLLGGSFVELSPRDVGGIVGAGGTILGSSRSPDFQTEEGQRTAIRRLSERDIDAIIIIGGSGSQRGAFALSQMGFPVVGVASTIDNDLFGSDITIGVDTALNVALEAIDRIKVTASSHQRVFAVEVMGRDCGYLALMSGIAGGAEVIIVPEVDFDIQKLEATIHEAYQKGKHHAIIVTSEGAIYNAEELTRYFSGASNLSGYELRTTVLGYVQRGAVPGVFDRILATRLGAAAVDCIGRHSFGVLTGIQKSEITTTPLKLVASRKKELDTSLLGLADLLAK